MTASTDKAAHRNRQFKTRDHYNNTSPDLKVIISGEFLLSCYSCGIISVMQMHSIILIWLPTSWIPVMCMQSSPDSSQTIAQYYSDSRYKATWLCTLHFALYSLSDCWVSLIVILCANPFENYIGIWQPCYWFWIFRMLRHAEYYLLSLQSIPIWLRMVNELL